MRAIEINGAGVEGNKAAFRLGRWAVADPRAVAALAGEAAAPVAEDLDAQIARRAAHLEAYQDRRLAERYRARVEAARAVDADLGAAVALGYHKLLAYKDEYEVARLHASTLEAAVAAGFEDVRAMRFHLAPPFLSRPGPDGRPAKREFGPWMLGAMKLLARFKGLRGTAFDPFGRTEERRMERGLIAEYEADLDRLQAALTPETRAVALELARLPLEIRGFGPVKAKAAEVAAARRAELLAAFAAGGLEPVHAAA